MISESDCGICLESSASSWSASASGTMRLAAVIRLTFPSDISLDLVYLCHSRVVGVLWKIKVLTHICVA